MAKPKSKSESKPWHKDDLELWRPLLVQTERLYALAPWKWLSERESFTLRDPVTGTNYYAQLLGTAGQVLSLNLFSGEIGLSMLRSLQAKKINRDKLRTEMDLLQVSFEDRADLEDWDAELLLALGLRFRGSKVYPQFRSYKPGFYPWALDRQEIEVLNRLLPPALDFLEQATTNMRAFFPGGKRMVALEKAGEVWTRTTIEPEPQAAPIRPAVPPDEFMWRRLLNSTGKVAAGWDMGMIPMENPVMEGGRPFFSFIVLCIDSASEKVLGFQLSPWNDLPRVLPMALAKVVEELGLMPESIQVENAEVQEWLTPAAEAAGIEIRREKTLRSLQEFRKSMTTLQ